ncbi:phosphate ABC transporter permease PstA [Dethiosulfatibacter aminovorans]
MEEDIMTVKVTRPGEGILPMLVTTLEIILISLLVACPIGIFGAIYLTEYAKQGRLVKIIRFATESLAGIPSIIYGLFGMIFFVTLLKFDYSILSGALTLSIILLPVIIRQTEESLKAVPDSYREGSLGLGATKLQTIRKVVLPNAISGIIVAVILSIGRIVGESAALLLTAGTVAHIPKTVFNSGATLTVKAYTVAKEAGDIEMACAIGTVVIIMILILNALSKMITLVFNKSE